MTIGTQVSGIHGRGDTGGFHGGGGEGPMGRRPGLGHAEMGLSVR